MADLTTQPVSDAILESLKSAAAYNRDDVARPAAILWPDETREWESPIPRLRAVLPRFLVFGPYEKPITGVVVFSVANQSFFCSCRLFQWRYMKPSQQSLAAAIDELGA